MSAEIDKINAYNEKIKELDTRVESLKESRMTCKVKLEQLEENERKLIAEIRARGYDPDALTAAIAEKESRLDALLLSIDKMLPDENGVWNMDEAMEAQADISSQTKAVEPEASEEEVSW